MRRSLVELNAALADAMLETSFATFRASMAAFSEERTSSGLFVFWGLSAMVQAEKAVWRVDCEEEPGPLSR